MKKVSDKNRIWIFIIVIIIVFSAPSVIDAYKIKELFLSSQVRENAVGANMALRKVYGMGATDLILEKIDKTVDKTVFYFSYYYHHPDKIFHNKKRSFKVTFKDKELINLEDYEE